MLEWNFFRRAIARLGSVAAFGLTTAAIAAPSAASSTSEAKGVDQAIREWAQSWDRGDVTQYLAHYAGNFIPPGGLSRSQWEAQRRARLKNTAVRYVLLRDLRVDVAANEARARFVQHYVDLDQLSTATKRLTLVKQAGAWKIREEQVEAERVTRR